MKKSLLALGAVAALGGLGFSGAANAVWVVGDVADAGANKLVPADTGVGHILVTPYFSTVNKDGNGANTTLLSVVNTDTENGKAVKVRFRGAANSDDVLDFTVLLSPGDVWSASVSQGADGFSRLYSPDSTCVLPDQPNANGRQSSSPDGISFSDLRLDQTLSESKRAAHTQEGYVEWLNMADITKDSPIYKAIKHSDKGVPDCTQSVMSKLVGSGTSNYWDVDQAADSGFVAPTGNLMGNWTIFNNANVTSYGGPASAIVAVDSETGLPSTGRLFFAPQTDKDSATFPAYAAGTVDWAGDTTYYGETADPLLTNVANGGIAKTPILAFDLPDLSTPYVNGHLWAASQSNALSNALAAQTVMNEWTAADAASTNGTYFATDWVFSQPTRRYHVVLDYAPLPAGSAPVAVHNQLTKNNFYTSSVVEVGKNDYGSMVCLQSGVPVYNIFNREEGTTAPVFDDGQWSPRRPTKNRGFCGEVAVMQFGEGAVRALNGQVTKETIATGTIGGAGWMSMAFSGAVKYGLPVVGYAANTFNGSNGVNVGNYGDAITHRYKRSTTQAPSVTGPYSAP